MMLDQLIAFLRPERSERKDKQRKERLLRKLHEQRNRTFDHGFLHIPKTGGSGIDDLFNRLAEQGVTCPVKFTHSWSVNEILELYPDIRLSFVIRDPIERVVSGFLSRMRMGRPRNNSFWTTNEAISFAFFDSPRRFFMALAGDDERELSAAKFAYRSIQHIRLNYVHYFESVENLERVRDRIELIGTLDDMPGFLRQLAARIDEDGERYLSVYRREHASAYSSGTNFDAEEIEKIQAVLSEEYAIYNHLKMLVNC